MRSLGRNAPEVDTVRALARLAEVLDENLAPIDYARRRAIDYSDLLPRDEWHDVCRTANVLPGGDRRWQLARAHLYAQLSGNRLARAPFGADASFPSFVELQQFRDGLPEVVTEALQSSGAEFLKSRGIDEPVSWMPELDAASTQTDVPARSDREWPLARPARAAVKPSRAVAAYSAGSAKPKIRYVRRKDLSEFDAKRLRHRQERADRRVRRRPRLRLALFVLLVRVARQPRTVGDILLAEADFGPETPEVPRELACIVTPGRVFGSGALRH